jgi:hypothetical protein
MTPPELNRLKQIVGEFHGIHNLVQSEAGKNLLESVLQKLTNSHTFVNLHANNWGKYDLVSGFLLPDVLEFTLVRNDRLSPTNERNLSSENLNQPNNPNAPELFLGFLSEI